MRNRFQAVYCIIFWLALAGCVSHQRVAVDNGFAVGQTYETTTGLFAVTWGKRTTLVSQYNPTQTAGKAKSVVHITAGTTLEVTSVQSDNTLTRGIDHWPQAKILSGPLINQLVSLDVPGLQDHFRPHRKSAQ